MNSKYFIFLISILIFVVGFSGVGSAVDTYNFIFSTDDSISNHTITLNENPIYNYTGFYNFEGTKTYGKITDTTDLQISNNISVSVWVKLPQYDAGNIISRYQGVAGGRQWTINSIANKIQLFMGNQAGTSQTYTLTSSTNLSLDTWYNLAFTFTNDTYPNNTLFYINGINEVNASKIDLINSTQTLPIYFGRQTDTSGVGASIIGAIDEIRIYNSSLSSAQINQIYTQGRVQNVSLLNNSLVLYSSFNRAGDIIVTGGTGNVPMNFSHLYANISDQNRINFTSPNIYDIYSTLQILTASDNFTSFNEIIRLNSKDENYSFLDIRSLNVNIYNSTFYSWNGSDYDRNTSYLQNNRSYIKFKNSNVNISFSNFSYLGYVDTDTSDLSRGTICQNCDNSILNNNIFSFMARGIIISLSSDNVILKNNIIFNITGNGTKSISGIFIGDSDNVIVQNNTIYNIYKDFYSADDSTGIQLYGPLNNASVLNNTIYNSETGIAFYSAQVGFSNSSIIGNNITNTPWVGIKLEGGNQTNILIDNNIINFAGNSSIGGTWSASIVEDVNSNTETRDNNITISNNKISNSPKGIRAYYSDNLIIRNNIVSDTLDISLGYLGYPADAVSVINSYGIYGFYQIRNLTIFNNSHDTNPVLHSYSFFNNSGYNLSGLNTFSIINYKNGTSNINESIPISLLTNTLIYFSNNSVACSNINSCDGNINITLSPNNYSYVLDNFNLTEGVSRTFSPLSITTSTNTRVSIASTLSDAITTDVILTRKTDWGNNCELVSKITYTPKGGTIQTYTGLSAKSFCVTLTTTGQNLLVNPSSSSNEFVFEIGSTPLTSSILKIMIGLLATLVVVFAAGGCIYYVKNNFRELSIEQIITFSITLLIFTLLTIMLMNYIAEII